MSCASCRSVFCFRACLVRISAASPIQKIELQLLQQMLEPPSVTARFYAHPYYNSSARKLTIESFGFLGMLQTSFLKLTPFCIYTRYLLKLGMEIYSYNDHCSAPFSRALVG